MDITTNDISAMLEREREEERKRAIAQENLNMVIKAIGATNAGTIGRYQLETSLGKFTVAPSAIFLEEPNNKHFSTCYYPCTKHGVGVVMPWQENVASALLLLKDNPKIFFEWASQLNAPVIRVEQ